MPCAPRYASWQRPEPPADQHALATDLAGLLRWGNYRVLTHDGCLADAREPGASFRHFPIGGGTPPEIAWQSLELYADQVLPHLGPAVP